MSLALRPFDKYRGPFNQRPGDEDELIEIDMNRMAGIYDYYFFDESRINACRRVLLPAAFSEGIQIVLEIEGTDLDLKEGAEAGGAVGNKSRNIIGDDALRLIEQHDHGIPGASAYKVPGSEQQAKGINDGVNQRADEMEREQRRRDEERMKRESQKVVLTLDRSVTKDYETAVQIATDYKLLFGMCPYKINREELQRRFGHESSPAGPATRSGEDDDGGGDGDDGSEGDGSAAAAAAGGASKRRKTSPGGGDGGPEGKVRSTASGGSTTASHRGVSPVISIPPIGSGFFAIKMEGTGESRRPRVVFAVEDESTVPGLSGRRRLREAKDIHMFVWPDTEPPVSGDRVQSAIFPLYKQWTDLQKMKSDILDASDASSHPVLFTSKRPAAGRGVRGDADSMFEQELLADTGVYGSDPSAQRSYLQAVERRVMMDAAQAFQQYKERVGGARYRMSAAAAAGGGPALEEQVADPLRSRVDLDDGVDILKPPVPSVVGDYQKMLEDYHTALFLTMGVPRASMEGHAGSRSQSLSANQQLENQMLGHAVNTLRSDARLFIQHVYEEMFRDMDDRLVENVIFELNEGLPLADLFERHAPGRFRAASGARAGATKQALLDHIAQTFRVQVKFPNDPTSNTFSMQDVMALGDRGAISGMEELNMLRGQARVPKISDPSHPLIAGITMRRESQIRSSTAAAAPPAEPKNKQQPGGGDSDKKKK